MSVRLSHAGIVSKRLNVESRKQYHTIAQWLLFSDAKNLGEIPTESLPTWALNRGGVGSNGDFDQYLSETVHSMGIVTVKR